MDKCNVADIGHGSMNAIASKFDAPMWRDYDGQYVTGKPGSWDVTLEVGTHERRLHLRFWSLMGRTTGSIVWNGPECPCDKIIAVLEALGT